MTIRHVTAESVCRIRLPSSSKAPFLHSIQNGWLVDRRHALLAHTHGDANRQIVGLSHETDPELSPCPPPTPLPDAEDDEEVMHDLAVIPDNSPCHSTHGRRPSNTARKSGGKCTPRCSPSAGAAARFPAAFPRNTACTVTLLPGIPTSQ